jgi:peptidoglycan hydrolase-like protein with peptidoglycan-binding domain
LLRELAVVDKAVDGSPRHKFHLASAPPKWVTVNGNDLGIWFQEPELRAAQPRLLKPAEPPMKGADVTEVQHALAAAKLSVEQDGVYRISTAAAVARFQKQKNINVSGAVDTATRRALGLSATQARPAGRN